MCETDKLSAASLQLSKTNKKAHLIFIFYRQEIDSIRKKSATPSAIAALEFTSAPMGALITVITLALTGNPLTPANVFMPLAFISLLQWNFCMNLPNGLLETYDAYVSLGRLEQFLLMEDLLPICRNEAVDDTRNTDRRKSSERNSPTDHQAAVQDVFVSDILVRNFSDVWSN